MIVVLVSSELLRLLEYCDLHSASVICLPSRTCTLHSCYKISLV